MTVQGNKSAKDMPFSPGVGCLISFIIAVLPVCLIMSAAGLALRGEFSVDLGPIRQARLWVVREGQEQGVGLSTMGKVAGSEQAGRVCYQTNVRFLLWRGLKLERETGYCDCYEFDANNWQYAGVCP